MAGLFDSLTLRGTTFRNRIMMSPMAQYSSPGDGMASEWHLVHYGSRAVGGVALIMLEATAVAAIGRITEGDLGLYDDRHVEPLKRIVDFCHKQGAKVGVQLAHSGRKAWSDKQGKGPAVPVGPSAIAYADGWVTPEVLNGEDIDGIVTSFGQAARRAKEAGFDVVEIHAAHGYLIHEFLSPLSNKRTDEYGGSLENRLRLAHLVMDMVRKEWPEDAPLFVRVSATDWAPGGIDVDQIVEITRTFKEHGVDLIDTSSGGLVVVPVPVGAGYQAPFAERIRKDADIPTAAVGLITTPEMADAIVRMGIADMVALGRELLRHPHFPLDAATELRVNYPWPVQYERAKK